MDTRTAQNEADNALMLIGGMIILSGVMLAVGLMVGILWIGTALMGVAV